MAQRQTRLDEWLTEQDSDQETEGGYLLRVLTVAVLTSAVIYIGGHVIAALVR